MYVRYEIILRTGEKEKRDREDLGEVVDTSEEENELRLISLTKEEVLDNILKDLHHQKKIFGESWTSTDRGTRWKVTFRTSSDDADNIDNELRHLGFGAKGSQTVVFIAREEFSDGFPNAESEKNEEPLQKNFVEAMKMTTGSLTVRRVLENIKQKATLTPECMVQLFSAAVLSGLGLGLNVVLFIVASMFLAPFMEAMNLLIFSYRIKETKIVWHALKTFLIYVMIIFFVGLLCGGLMIGYVLVWNSYIETDRREYRIYPTFEMYQRSTLEALFLGFVVSSVSSLSTYTSIVNPRSDNVHVGNAISLSLVPPLCNSGMYITTFFVCSGVLQFMPQESPCFTAWNMCGNQTALNDTIFLNLIEGCRKDSIALETMLRAKNDYPDPYICHMKIDFLKRAGITFSVMAINVVMLFLIGSLMLWLAKFTPIKLGPKHIHSFHKYDIDYYQQARTIKTRDPQNTGVFLDALKKHAMQTMQVPEKDYEVMVQSAQHSVHYQTITGGNYQQFRRKLPSTEHYQEVPFAPTHAAFTNSYGSVRRRNRILSENQQTIRNTILSEEFDSHPGLQRQWSKPRHSAEISENHPLRSPRRNSQNVGRFQVTAPVSPEP